MAKGNICRISNCTYVLLQDGAVCGKHKWRMNKFKSWDLPSYHGVPNYYVEDEPYPEGIVHKCPYDHGFLTIDDVYEISAVRKKNGEAYYTCKKCARDGNIRRNYKGMNSMEDYNKMHEAQNGLCAICNLPNSSKSNNKKTIKSLAVDHCHKTNKVRELLCQNCNTGIGYFKESIAILQLAINYLEKHK